MAADDNGAGDRNAVIHFTPSKSGVYFIGVHDVSGHTGQYTIDFTAVSAFDRFLSSVSDPYIGSSQERIVGGWLADIVNIGTGKDALGEQGPDSLTGNNHRNFISGGDGDDSLIGNGESDVIFGGHGADFIDGGSGNDHVYGGGDIDAIYGDGGDDFVLGGDSRDLVSGGYGNDTLQGNNGDDQIQGGAGADILDGGAGVDWMSGGDGNDTFYVDDSNDIVDENGTFGSDTVYSSISVDLGDGDHFRGDLEKLYLTGAGNLSVSGGGLADYITGNAGNNNLNGKNGSDTLFGSAGSDKLTGGLGNDKLTGGDGGDLFIFASVADSNMSAGNRDWIRDFSPSEGDKISLSAIDAKSTVDGNQIFGFIGTSNFTHHAGELRNAVVNDDAYVYADTDGDGKADFSIVLQGVTSLQANDFIL